MKKTECIPATAVMVMAITAGTGGAPRQVKNQLGRGTVLSHVLNI